MLLLDSGNLFPASGSNRKQIAETALKAMGLMDYGAMNLGWSDLSLGTDFFEEMRSTITFPLITSNLVHKDSRLPYGKKYVIKTIGDVRVGILGVMPLNSIYQKAVPPGDGSCPQNRHKSADHEHAQEKKAPFTDQLEIIPPGNALKNLVPEVRTRADIVILLSQCGFDATTLLVDNVDGIDLAISGPSRTRRSGKSKVPIIETGYIGKRMGSVKLTSDGAGWIIKAGDEMMISLNDRIPYDSSVIKITSDDIDKKIRDEELQKMKKEAEALFKLTPYEYYEMLIKEQSEAQEKK